MSPEQMSQALQQLMQEITVIKTKQDNDHTRIEENRRFSQDVGKLTVNLENLTTQLKKQNERLDKHIDTFDERLDKHIDTFDERLDKLVGSFDDRLGKHIDVCDSRFKTQGERVGALESVAGERKLVIDKLLKRTECLEADVKEIQTKGSRRWDGVVEKVICVVIGAAIMAVMYNFGF